jgi:3',5'-cyclic AMP phosphodiesterase CpdA
MMKKRTTIPLALAALALTSLVVTAAAKDVPALLPDPGGKPVGVMKPVKILEVNDLHIVNEASLAYPRKVIAAMNKEGGDLAIIPGDLAKDGKRSELELARDVLGGLKMPYFVVQGNHDVLHGGEKEETLFREVFSLKSNSYHVTAKGIHFIVIAHGCGRAYQKNAVRPDVLAWMRKTLGSIRDEKPYILVSHYPFARGVRYRTPNADEVLSLFKDRKLLAVMSGHFHGNTENIENGVLMTTTACSSGTRGNHDGTKAKGYRVFHIDGNMEIKTEFREVKP